MSNPLLKYRQLVKEINIADKTCQPLLEWWWMVGLSKFSYWSYWLKTLPSLCRDRPTVPNTECCVPCSHSVVILGTISIPINWSRLHESVLPAALSTTTIWFIKFTKFIPFFTTPNEALESNIRKKMFVFAPSQAQSILINFLVFFFISSTF